MSELAHHLLGAAWNFLFLAGILTVAARLWLGYRLDRLDHPALYDEPDVLAALIFPAFLPLAWLGSSVVHLMEPGHVIDRCCAMLSSPGASEMVFGTGIIGLLLVQAFSLRRKWRRGHAAHLDVVGGEQARVRRICAEHPRLAAMSVRVVACQTRSCLTRGFLNPWIEVSSELVSRLDDDALEAALLHEAGHARHLDPLRSSVVLAAQILNPFASLLTRHAEAWRFATEVARDCDAVGDGARPVALADALVTTAHCQFEARVAHCHLHGSGDALEARVRLLLSVVSPRTERTSAGVRWLVATLVAGLALPHLLGAPLFALHCVLERLLA